MLLKGVHYFSDCALFWHLAQRDPKSRIIVAMKSKTSPKLFLTAVALSLVFLSGLSAKPAMAWDFNANRAVADVLDNWLQNNMIAIINRTAIKAALGCNLDEIVGDADITNKTKQCVTGLGVNVFGRSGQAAPASLLGMSSSLAFDAPVHSEIYPVNLAVYLNSIRRDSPIIPTEAYAAGTTGDTLLGGPILALWQLTRNLAYVIFVLMLVVFGFMVMFRYKINPQTVITVQEALPKVVINLLLITFSYPIGVLAINLVGTLSKFSGNAGVFPVGSDFGTTLGLVVGHFVSALTLAAVPGGALLLSVVVVGAVIAVILFVFALAISILTRFARIILMVVAAPLQFAFATIPGNEGLVTSWFKSLIGNVLAIPAMLFVAGMGILIMLDTGVASSFTTADYGMKFVVLVMGNIIGYVIGLWFLWNARKAPQWIEGAMGIGGGWSPGMAPKPGKK